MISKGKKMLWYDDSPKTEFEQKVLGAAEYYEKKYGQAPNICFVHPSMVNGSASQNGNVEIRTTTVILPNHFWIGVNQE